MKKELVGGVQHDFSRANQIGAQRYRSAEGCFYAACMANARSAKGCTYAACMANARSAEGGSSSETERE